MRSLYQNRLYKKSMRNESSSSSEEDEEKKIERLKRLRFHQISRLPKDERRQALMELSRQMEEEDPQKVAARKKKNLLKNKLTFEQDYPAEVILQILD